MRKPEDVQFARRTIRALIGPRVLADLHRQNPFLDIAGIVLVYTSLGICAHLLGKLPLGLPFLVLLLLQGFLLQLPALLFHDLCLHRRFPGERWCWYLSCGLTLPLLIRPTAYEAFHLDHHRYVGTDLDSENFKQEINTKAKRFALATLPGFLLQKRWPFHKERLGTRALRRLELEGRLILGVLGLWLLGLCLWPALFGLGFLLPMVLTLPIAIVLRIILEHGEANPENRFHLAIFYRCGSISGPLFLYDCGDFHLIHHIFPRIPFYRMGRAIEVMAPIFRAQQVTERTSFWQILWGYFIKNEPHRAPWSSRSP